MKATYNGVVIAKSNNTIVVEGNHYFPPDSVNQEYLEPNNKHTRCPWKGKASYYDIVVDGEVNSSAAWYYSDPSFLAKKIKDHVAFWNGVEVSG
jgi:uncharacterized protein (DUF427 family)